MSIRFVTDSQRVKVLRSLHGDNLPDKRPLTQESIDFLFAYIETLETELERATGRAIYRHHLLSRRTGFLLHGSRHCRLEALWRLAAVPSQTSDSADLRQDGHFC